tara:strand:+ start:201 stop:962 length:762 start_codon:yes stop_codon:yes gene_type:complete
MFNFSAIYSIIAFRIKEFLQEYHYSLLAPLTTNLLFILVFLTVENYYSLSIDSGSFVEFIAPGLIIMIVAQESYDNSSATLIHMKQIGSLDDWLMAPLYRVEILISLISTSLIIGIILALFNFIIFTFFIDIQIYNFFYFFYYLFLVIIFFSCLGCFVGLIFNSWDTQSTFSSFFVSPINFLSGTFFSINYLPENFKTILLYNPYYYVVKFFRSSFKEEFYFNIYENLFVLIFIITSLTITAFIFFKGFKVIK